MIKEFFARIFPTKSPEIPDTKTIGVTAPDTSEYYSLAFEPNTIKAAFSAKEYDGSISDLHNLFSTFLEADDNAGGCVEVREEALKAAIPVITNTDLSDKQLEVLKPILASIWSPMAEMVVEYKLYGHLFRQIIWDFDGSIWKPKEYRSYKNVDLKLKDGELCLYLEDEKKTLNPLKFFALTRKKSPLQGLLKYYCFAFFSINNWAAFTEVFGKPYIVGKYSPQATKADKDKLFEFISSAGNDMAGIISESTAIEFMHYADKQASSDLYSNLVKFTQDRVTRRILGQTLTTTAEKTGSYAQSKVHNLVREDILAGDIRDATNLLQFHINQIAAINLGIEGIEIKIEPTSQKDLKERINIDEKLNNIIVITPDYFYETYGIPIPKDGAKFKEKESTSPFHGREQGSLSEQSDNGLHLLPTGLGTRASSSQSSLPTASQKALVSVRKRVDNLKSYQEVKDLAYPTDLYLALGNDMWSMVLNSYIKVRKQQGKKTKLGTQASLLATGTAGILPATGNADIPVRTGYAGILPAQSLEFEFEFTDQDIEALNAFRSESFIVAGVSSQSVLDLVKNEAEKAFTEGLDFTEFRKNLKLQGFEPKNPYYLRTNFNTAFANAQAAAKWQNIQEDKKLFPYLRYVAIMDGKTRDEHAILHNIIRPVEDPFWNDHTPPNGFNCRCDLEQETPTEAENDPGLKRPIPPNTNVPPEWRRNAGKDKTLFGSWLSCEDAKSLQDANPGINPMALRLHLFYALKKHCPLLYAKKAPELGLKEWEKLKTHKLPELIDTNGMTREDLFKLWKKKMNDSIVIDATNDPVKLKSSVYKWNQKKNGKLEYSDKNLQGRFRYLNCIEDTLKNPTEIWGQEDRKRFRYIKKYETGVMVVTEVEADGKAGMFNIIASNKGYINARRSGFLIYSE